MLISIVEEAHVAKQTTALIVTKFQRWLKLLAKREATILIEPLTQLCRPNHVWTSLQTSE